MEILGDSLYEIVEKFITNVYKIISAVLALLGLGKKDEAEEDVSE